jgi:hypothetical protein
MHMTSRRRFLLLALGVGGVLGIPTGSRYLHSQGRLDDCPHLPAHRNPEKPSIRTASLDSRPRQPSVSDRDRHWG